MSAMNEHNAFRNIDRHYKNRHTIVRNTSKLEPTDFTSAIDFRSIESNSSHNKDVDRIITVATRQGDFDDTNEWDWQVEPGFNQQWTFSPSSNIPVTGDGCPPKKPAQITTTTSSDTPPKAYPPPRRNNNATKNIDQYQHPFHPYRVDNSGQCGGKMSKIYAVDQVPGLFVISGALHYTSQLVWALRCFVTYEKDYTNLYNLFFVLPEKGVKDGLETVPDQENLPDDLKVKSVEDIQELFFKACSNAVKVGLVPQTLGPLTTSTNNKENDTSCEWCVLAEQNPKAFCIHSHVTQSQNRQQQQPECDDHLTNQKSPPQPNIPYSYIPPLTLPQSNFHTENSLNLAALKRLRWASLGYHYDWTDREYADDNHSPFPLELFSISQQIIQPLIGHGIVTPLIPEAGIINYYPIGTRMGAHIDDAELAVQCPIVSFSVGLTAVFVIGNKSRREEPIHLLLRSGDVLIQDGVSRLAFHGVPRIVEDSLPLGSLAVAGNALLNAYYSRKQDDENTAEKIQPPESTQATQTTQTVSDNAQERDNTPETDPTTAPDYIMADTLDHFTQLVSDIQPLMEKYNLSIEQVLTFLLHVLCEYRINFNTRQVRDPERGSSLAEVRQKFPIDAVKRGVYEDM